MAGVLLKPQRAFRLYATPIRPILLSSFLSPSAAFCYRAFHSGPSIQHAAPTKRRQAGAVYPTPASMGMNPPLIETPTPSSSSPIRSLSCLPLPSLLRNIFIAEVSSRHYLLNPSLRLLSAVAYSKHSLLDVTRNRPLRWLLKNTLYTQFCAGETPPEVQATVSRLRAWGIQGILLGWAREVECRGETECVTAVAPTETTSDISEIESWLTGIRSTLSLTSAGDVVCIKLTGAGFLTRQSLRLASPPSPTLATGLESLSKVAAEKGVAFEIDAEQVAVQPGIEKWSLDLQRRFNTHAPTVVSTYQAYLKATPARLGRDLATAARERFVLGVKLVRGAYLGSDPREQIWASKEETDRAYDGMARALVRREWAELTRFPNVVAQHLDFPRASLILATHNRNSARCVLAAQQDMTAPGGAAVQTPVLHAQLMGMADHVSCELVAQRREMLAAAAQHGRVEAENTQIDTPLATAPVPKPYKYLVWGSLSECLQYLVRRAEENRDAATRTEEGRLMLWAELRRRLTSRSL